ncbi:MAG: hypothetical protein SOY70_04320 [Veillonellaceae bacterium]|nr:hypothetical protein [Veillonellaceae bacterium]
MKSWKTMAVMAATAVTMGLSVPAQAASVNTVTTPIIVNQIATTEGNTATVVGGTMQVPAGVILTNFSKTATGQYLKDSAMISADRYAQEAQKKDGKEVKHHFPKGLGPVGPVEKINGKTLIHTQAPSDKAGHSEQLNRIEPIPGMGPLGPVGPVEKIDGKQLLNVKAPADQQKHHKKHMGAYKYHKDHANRVGHKQGQFHNRHFMDPMNGAAFMKDLIGQFGTKYDYYELTGKTATGYNTASVFAFQLPAFPMMAPGMPVHASLFAKSKEIKNFKQQPQGINQMQLKFMTAFMNDQMPKLQDTINQAIARMESRPGNQIQAKVQLIDLEPVVVVPNTAYQTITCGTRVIANVNGFEMPFFVKMAGIITAPQPTMYVFVTSDTERGYFTPVFNSMISSFK